MRKTCKKSSLTEFTATILLIVEGIFTQQLVAAVAQSSLPPVLCPEHRAGYAGLGCEPCFSDLFDTLPARRCQGGGEMNHAKTLGLPGCLQESEPEALQAAASAFWLSFQPPDGI